MAKRRAGRRRGGPNKSAAIREVFEQQGIDAVSKDVIAVLAARGIAVSSAHVANERARQLQKAQNGGVAVVRRGGKAGRKRGRPTAASTVARMEGTLLEAKRLADMVGGIDEARKALDLLAKLQRN